MRLSMDTPNLTDLTAVKSAAIHISGLTATLKPGVQQVAEALTAPGLRFTPGGPQGYQWQYQPTTLCKSDNWGGLVFRAGQVPRVADLLQRSGVPVRITDDRHYSDVHTPDPHALAGEAHYRDLLLALQGHPLGQIVPRQPREIPDILASICRVFPQARIVVAVATKRQARGLWCSLRQLVPGTAVRLVTGGTRTHAGRVSVCTYPRIGTLSWEGIDMLLFPGPSESLPDYAFQFGGPSGRPLRVYTLSANSSPRRDTVTLRLEAIAGPVIYDGRPAPVEATVCLRESGYQAANHPGTPLDRKQALWRDTARNRRIAIACRALATGDERAMLQLGFPPAVAQDLARHRRRITVVVESLHHRFLLQQLLPGWTLMGGVNGEYGAHRVPDGAPGRIVTELYLAHHPVDADVLIRASGEGTLGDLGIPLLATDHPEGKLLIVDYLYGSSHDVQRRIGEYRGYGWMVHTATNPIPYTTAITGGHTEGS
jgi:hypothetical protein